MNAIILISILGIFAMMSEFIGLKKLIYPIILISLVGILGYNIYSFWGNPEMHYGMLNHDNYSVAFGSLLITITLFWFLLSRESYSEGEFNPGDHYALILFSTVESKPTLYPKPLNKLNNKVTVVVFPLVPVIPTNFIFSEGLSKKLQAI